MYWESLMILGVTVGIEKNNGNRNCISNGGVITQFKLSPTVVRPWIQSSQHQTLKVFNVLALLISVSSSGMMEEFNFIQFLLHLVFFFFSSLRVETDANGSY